jgi:hypothetical protein
VGVATILIRDILQRGNSFKMGFSVDLLLPSCIDGENLPPMLQCQRNSDQRLPYALLVLSLASISPEGRWIDLARRFTRRLGFIAYISKFVESRPLFTGLLAPNRSRGGVLLILSPIGNQLMIFSKYFQLGLVSRRRLTWCRLTRVSHGCWASSRPVWAVCDAEKKAWLGHMKKMEYENPVGLAPTGFEDSAQS